MVRKDQFKLLRGKLLLFSVVLMMLVSVSQVAAQAYGSHTFEGTELVFDRPYIANVSANAYACITPPKTDTIVTTSTNAKGDNVTVTTTFDTKVPVLYEYVDNKWFWASNSGVYNQMGNPCTNGKTSIWFNNFQLSISNNSAAQKMSVELEIAAPFTHITTVTKHKVFLGFSNKVTKTTTGGGENIVNGNVDIYRSARDACNSLVGNKASFLADAQSYQRRSDIYTRWFPYSFACDM
jgi:hypothetical protein